jgi:putative acetyltransferase
MSQAQPPLQLRAVAAREPEVMSLLDALTSELAVSGYTAAQTFGYSTEQLERSAVHLVGAWIDARLVGLAGLELQDTETGELKRFYVTPDHRGTGVADALLTELTAHAREHGRTRLRLETGDRQRAAIAFYRRHGFAEVSRFGPYVRSATSVCMQRDLPGG